MTHKGIFSISKPEKYIGDSSNIVFRSSWEKLFMRFLNDSPMVKRWASEEIFFRYYLITDKKWHRYYPDFYVELVTGDKFIIEVKPFHERVYNKRKTNMDTFIKNQSKWETASKVASENNLKFIVMDEYDLRQIGVRIPIKSIKVPRAKLLFENTDQYRGSVSILTEPLIKLNQSKKK